MCNLIILYHKPQQKDRILRVYNFRNINQFSSVFSLQIFQKIRIVKTLALVKNIMNFESGTQDFNPLENAERAVDEAVMALKEAGVDVQSFDPMNMDNLTPEQRKTAENYMRAFQNLEEVKSKRKAA